MTAVTCFGHIFELLCAERPSADSEKNLEFWIGFFETDNALIEAGNAILLVVVAFEGAEFAFFQPAKCEDDVRAQICWDVFGQEFTDLCTVLGPICVVADDLEREINGKGWRFQEEKVYFPRIQFIIQKFKLGIPSKLINPLFRYSS